MGGFGVLGAKRGWLGEGIGGGSRGLGDRMDCMTEGESPTRGQGIHWWPWMTGRAGDMEDQASSV